MPSFVKMNIAITCSIYNIIYKWGIHAQESHLSLTDESSCFILAFCLLLKLSKALGSFSLAAMTS